MNTIIDIIILVIGCIVITKFADLLGEYIRQIGIKLRIPISVRGVVFDGVSSSTPEFIVSAAAAVAALGILSGTPDPTAFEDVGIGAIGGSAIFNILVIPWLSVLFVSKEKLKTIQIDRKAMLRDMLVYLIAVGLLYFGAKQGVLTPLLGWIMTITYLLYLAYLVKEAKSKPNETTDEIITTKKRWLLLKSALVLIPIAVAVHYCVVAATSLGETYQIPRLIMSLVILAAATSLPDALLSIKSAKNNELDASISNAVGSNSFDILICLGFVIAIANTRIQIRFEEIQYVFGFLILSSVCYTIAFYFNFNKLTKMTLLSTPYLLFISYLIKTI